MNSRLIDPPNAPEILCCECGRPMRTRFQPGLMVKSEGYWLCTCLTPDCPMLGFTFSQINYPPSNLDQYLTTGRKWLEQERHREIPSL